MPRIRFRIHPTGHIEAQVEGVSDTGCHALVDEAASRVGVILDRRPTPPAPSGAAATTAHPTQQSGAPSIRIGEGDSPPG
jgi:hypothetical protein